MGEDLLSLKWNNHRPAFFHLLKLLREKGCYSDVTLACGSKFFSVHRLVLMACSDFFTEVFDHTQCQKPVIVLKDIKGQELESLLDYMYLGEVDVQQADLPGLIKAAECLRIRGLAIPDEDPTQTLKVDTHKPVERPAKRRRQEREIRDSDRSNVMSHSSERMDSRVSHVSQANVSQYTQHRTDVEIIQGNDLNAGMITVSHAGGETHLIAHDGTLAQRTNVLQVQADHTSSPSRSQSLEARLEHDSHLHEASHGQLNAETKHIETFTGSGTEIKVEHCDIEEEMEHGGFKSEVTDIHSDPLSEAVGGGEFTHFMTVEENLAHHMFQQAQQAGPSGLHRSQGRDGSTETGGDDSANRGPIGSSLYPTHLLGDAMTDATASGVNNQSGSIAGSGAFFPRDSIAQHHCPFCPQSFMFQSILKRHLRTHTGEKPYECPNCDYRSAYKYHVARHMKLHSIGNTVQDGCMPSISNSVSLLTNENFNMVQSALLGPEEGSLDDPLLQSTE